jgi:hypothetical protein
MPAEMRAVLQSRFAAEVMASSLLALVVAVGGCTTSVFVCASDADCSGGRCEPNGTCSFEDADCPSGRRYGKHGPSEIAEQCVPLESETAAETGDEAGGTSGVGTGSTVTTMATTAASDHQTSATTTFDEGGSSEDSATPGSSTETGDDGAGQIDCELGFDDAFEGDVLDPAWDLWTAGDLGTVVVSGGVVKFSIPASDHAWISILQQIGPFEEESAIAEIGEPASDPTAYVWFEVAGPTKYELGIDDGVLQVRAGESSNPTVLEEVPYDPVAHRFLRIRAASGVIEWAVSSGGQSWETLYDLPAVDGELEQNHRTAFGLGTTVNLVAGAEVSLTRFLHCL